MCMKNENCFECFSDIRQETRVIVADFDYLEVEEEISYSRPIEDERYNYEILLNSKACGREQRYGYFFELAYIHQEGKRRDFETVLSAHKKAIEVLMPENEIKALWDEYKSVGRIVDYFGLEDKFVVERLMELELLVVG